MRLTFKLPGSPSTEAVPAAFALMPCWHEASAGFLYRNPDTGVAFSAFMDPGGVPVFAVPALQSEIVAYQAAAEVASLANALLVPGIGNEVADRFLREWRACNEAAGASLGDAAVRTLPLAVHRAVWQWNNVRLAHIERLTTVEMLACTVPRVGLYGPPGADRTTVMTGVVWNAAAPMALPAVDLLIIPSDDEGITAIPLVALRPMLNDFVQREAGCVFGRSGVIHDPGLHHWLLDYVAPPPALTEALRLAVPRTLVPLDVHAVLDREFVDAVRGRPAVHTTRPGAN